MRNWGFAPSHRIFSEEGKSKELNRSGRMLVYSTCVMALSVFADLMMMMMMGAAIQPIKFLVMMGCEAATKDIIGHTGLAVLSLSKKESRC